MISKRRLYKPISSTNWQACLLSIAFFSGHLSWYYFMWVSSIPWQPCKPARRSLSSIAPATHLQSYIFYQQPTRALLRIFLCLALVSPTYLHLLLFDNLLSFMWMHFCFGSPWMPVFMWIHFCFGCTSVSFHVTIT